jgi:hypothetical protein
VLFIGALFSVLYIHAAGDIMCLWCLQSNDRLFPRSERTLRAAVASFTPSL